MIQNFSTNIFIYTLRIVNKLNRYGLYKPNIRKNIVLCYHDIGNSDWKFTLSEKVFEKHINILSNYYKVVTLKKIISDKGKEPRASITFDDGYENVYSKALPILEKYNIKACVFVLGNRNTRPNMPYKSKLMTINQIKKLILKGWDIGFHSIQHPDLTLLSNDSIKQEVYLGKKSLEEKIKRKVLFFAYPFGKKNKTLPNTLARYGYSAAFSVNGGYLKQKNNYVSDRITISQFIHEEEFEGLITPLGITINKIFTKLWQIKDNS